MYVERIFPPRRTWASSARSNTIRIDVSASPIAFRPVSHYYIEHPLRIPLELEHNASVTLLDKSPADPLRIPLELEHTQGIRRGLGLV